MTVSVLLADDQELIRSGLRMMIDSTEDLTVVGEAGDGVEAVRLAAELLPSVVVMDIRMPRVDGIEATRQIVQAHADGPRVLVLTTFDLDDHVFEAFRAGASGFLVKDEPRQYILDGIRAVAGGDGLASPSVTRRLIQKFAAAPGPEYHEPRGLDDLTTREREVLGLLARGLSNHELADCLHLSEKTVKTHVSRILMKLGLRDRVQAVILAYEAGIVMPGA
jgi:DNA-binding NarL/FixJ family response regulator